jgi:hypothetical protein
MNADPHDHDAALETDPVWRLLDHSAPAGARARFTDDTVRAARLSVQPRRWWFAALRPLPLSALAGAAAVLAFALIMPQSDHGASALVADLHADEIDEIANTEMLIAAADHPEQFSDADILMLCGF